MAQRQQSNWLHPTRLIIYVYAAAATIGTALLALPWATPDGRGATTVDTALFTSTSAVTVTGLVVVDTSQEWSTFGQIVILALIQLGGFGITTFASVFAVLMFRRLRLRARLMTQLERKELDLGELRPLIRRIAVFYVIVEVVGALILTVAFLNLRDLNLGEAVGHGTFHSVSAFNNAGFTTFPDGLVEFQSAPLVLMPVMLLVILGGIGFPVIIDLLRTRWKLRSWSLHTKLTVGTTALLIVVGGIIFGVLEWTNPDTLGGIPGTFDRGIDAVFGAVTPRTAGFNTVDYGEAHSSSQFLTMILMLIGGGSASSAGGIKVTTFALLGYVIVAELRGSADVNAFGRRISEATQRQAVAVALLGIGSVALGTLAVSATTPDLRLGDLLFEVVSAVGTTGLSTGVTPELEPVSRVVVSGLMFLGRLGPVTFGAALVLRQRDLLFRYPEGRPIIG